MSTVRGRCHSSDASPADVLCMVGVSDAAQAWLDLVANTQAPQDHPRGRAPHPGQSPACTSKCLLEMHYSKSIGCLGWEPPCPGPLVDFCGLERVFLARASPQQSQQLPGPAAHTGANMWFVMGTTHFESGWPLRGPGGNNLVNHWGRETEAGGSYLC